MEYAAAAESIVKLCGGNENISSVTHCATRLRLFIIDKSRVNLEEIKKIKGVLGTVYSGDELQIVLGKNLIPVFNEVVSIHNSSGNSKAAKVEKPAAESTPKTGKEK